MTDQIATLRQQMRITGPAPEQLPVIRKGAVAADGVLARLLKRPAAWVRRHKRHACCVVAVLEVIDKKVPIDGLVTEVSQGGLLFRPASSFVFDRRGSIVKVSFGDDEIGGEIVNVKPTGYGIRFHEEIDIERLNGLLDLFGLAPAPVAA